MLKGKSPAKSISFLWIPFNYPVRWAETPEDVPEWDTSRGYSAWEELPKETKDSSPNEAIKPPPATGYPRLVREHGAAKGSEDGRTYEGDDILNRLCALYPYINAWRAGKPVKKLKGDVLELAETYGPPYRDEDNTLEAWLGLVSRAHAATDTLRVLLDVGYVWMKDYLEGRCSDIIQLGTLLPNGRVHVDAPAEAEFYILKSFLTGAMLLEDRYWKNGNAEGAEQEAAKGFRVYMADSFYREFADPFGHRDDSGRAPLHFEPHGIYALSTIGDWALFKLSEEWRHGEGVKVCPVCGALFTPNHGNRKYCTRGSCAYRQHKQNKEDTVAESGREPSEA